MADNSLRRKLHHEIVNRHLSTTCQRPQLQ